MLSAYSFSLLKLKVQLSNDSCQKHRVAVSRERAAPLNYAQFVARIRTEVRRLVATFA